MHVRPLVVGHRISPGSIEVALLWSNDAKLDTPSRGGRTGVSGLSEHTSTWCKRSTMIHTLGEYGMIRLQWCQGAVPCQPVWWYGRYGGMADMAEAASAAVGLVGLVLRSWQQDNGYLVDDSATVRDCRCSRSRYCCGVPTGCMMILWKAPLRTGSGPGKASPG